MPDQTHEPLKILVVEDHPITRLGLRALVECRHDLCVVGEACDGEEAVELVSKLEPDLVIMDIQMPKMNGIEAAQIIHTQHPATNIMMLSSLCGEQDVLASFAAGATGFCLKDVDSTRLNAAIDTVRAGDIWLDSAIAGAIFGPCVKEEVKASVANFFATFRMPSPQLSLPRGRKSAPKKTKNSSFTLSARERQVLSLVVEGLNNQEIASRLVISLATAKTHVRNILNKLAVNDRTQAAVEGLRLGIVT